MKKISISERLLARMATEISVSFFKAQRTYCRSISLHCTLAKQQSGPSIESVLRGTDGKGAIDCVAEIHVPKAFDKNLPRGQGRELGSSRRNPLHLKN